MNAKTCPVPDYHDEGPEFRFFINQGNEHVTRCKNVFVVNVLLRGDVLGGDHHKMPIPLSPSSCGQTNTFWGGRGRGIFFA